MIVIHHNPACGTSRNVLAALREAGEEPVVIDYLTEGWTRPQLLGLFAAAGITARDALRVKGTPADEMASRLDAGGDASTRPSGSTFSLIGASRTIFLRRRRAPRGWC